MMLDVWLQKVYSIKNECEMIRAALVGRGGRGRENEPADSQFISRAQVVIGPAKAKLPNDQDLAGIKIEPSSSWIAVIKAMKTLLDKLGGGSYQYTRLPI
jgi:hypothetical protein